jgi:thioredoxin reductase
MFDVIIVGGSYAGMSAALPLARARRSIAIVDTGERRNRFAQSSHGFLGRDGHAPEAIAREAQQQLLAYPTVTWLEGRAMAASGRIDGFEVTLDDDRKLAGRRVVIACGVTDILPEIPGLAAHWGVGAMACPYCHGYELERGRIGVLATSPMALHQAMMLPEWGPTTLLVNGAVAPDAHELAELEQRGVAIEPVAVAEIGGEAGAPVAILRDGRHLAFDGLFVTPRTRIASAIPEHLGCGFKDAPLGPIVVTDDTRQTTVPGVFACGDVVRPVASVALAVGDGAFAGTATHRSLVFEAAAQARAA